MSVDLHDHLAEAFDEDSGGGSGDVSTGFREMVQMDLLQGQKPMHG